MSCHRFHIDSDAKSPLDVGPPAGVALSHCPEQTLVQRTSKAFPASSKTVTQNSKKTNNKHMTHTKKGQNIIWIAKWRLQSNCSGSRCQQYHCWFSWQRLKGVETRHPCGIQITVTTYYLNHPWARSVAIKVGVATTNKHVHKEPLEQSESGQLTVKPEKRAQTWGDMTWVKLLTHAFFHRPSHHPTPPARLSKTEVMAKNLKRRMH